MLLHFRVDDTSRKISMRRVLQGCKSSQVGKGSTARIVMKAVEQRVLVIGYPRAVLVPRCAALSGDSDEF